MPCRRNGERPLTARSSICTTPLPHLGSWLRVRFLDHQWFRNADPESVGPVVQEAYGKLDKIAQNHIRLLAAHYEELGPNGLTEQRVTGLVIVRSTILEIEEIGRSATSPSAGRLPA